MIRSNILALMFIFSMINLNFSHAQNFILKNAFPGLTFEKPVDFQNAGDGSDRIFVVSQPGKIHVFENDPEAAESGLFLDITERVDDSGWEMGLLGLAFHPEYESNGYYFVNYTAGNPLRTILSRFSVSEEDPNISDPDSELIILEFLQPLSNHNGGQIAFGPDHYLYIAIGDGGGGGDPGNNAQDKTNLLGTILRIDIDSSSDGLNYSIPTDNPYYGNEQGYREEIFAYGLRNPWRFSFDAETGWLWNGDVGQVSWEEINIIESGKNYGWNIMEGTHCYPPGTECDTTGLTLPIWEYPWGSEGRSVTGGYLYRGELNPELYGKYIYGDYISGKIWMLTYDGINPPLNELITNSNLSISSFGMDENGELYICNHTTGTIHTLQYLPTQRKDKSALPENSYLFQNYPNPFNPVTNISFSLPVSSHVVIEIFNITGERVESLVSEFIEAGYHTVRWDASGLPSGVYYYRMHVILFSDDIPIEFVDTRSLIYIR